MSAALLSESDFRSLAKLALDASKADHKFVNFSDRVGGTTRFALNRVVQNVNTRRYQLSFTATFGQKSGRASTSDLSQGAIRDVVRRAEALAELAPPDAEFLPPIAQPLYPVLASYRGETAAANPQRLARDAGEAIRQCKSADLVAAGIVSAYVSAVGVAASSGLIGYEQRSESEFSLTATGPDSTGWVNNANRSIDDLGVADRTAIAIEKARRSAGPRELPAGRYTAILEPSAVAGLLGPLLGEFRAKAYERGTSAVAGKLGQQIIDARLSLANRPDHPSLMGAAFDAEGIASNFKTWIDRGVLRELDYDPYSAQQKGVEPSFTIDAPHLSGSGQMAPGVDALIQSTERGVLVTNFWYIREVNPNDLTLTGMTRDGTFLIENGAIVGGLLNFRFHDSPLRALNAVDAFTRPLDAITMERGKMALPALKVRDFNFSSVTRF